MKWIINIEQTAGRLFNWAVPWNNQIRNLYPIAFCRFQLLAIFDKQSWQGALHQTLDLQLCKVPVIPSPLPCRIRSWGVCNEQPPLTGTAVEIFYYCVPQPQLSTQIMTTLIFLSHLKYDLSQKWKGKYDTPGYQSWLFMAIHRPFITRTAWASTRKGRLDWKGSKEFASALLNSPVVVTTWINNRCKNYLLGFSSTI